MNKDTSYYLNKFRERTKEITLENDNLDDYIDCLYNDEKYEEICKEFKKHLQEQIT
jgi:hypothetical protein|tara:strand:- start:1359 stop:1526 length:168 start_codon:yes stop_codon:yes gene_type:complete